MAGRGGVSLAPLSLRSRTGKNLYPADVYPEDMPQLQADVQPVKTFPVEVRGEEVFVGLPG